MEGVASNLPLNLYMLQQILGAGKVPSASLADLESLGMVSPLPSF